MAPSITSPYPVLNDTNYSVWVTQFSSELILLDLFDGVIAVDIEKEDMTDEEHKDAIEKAMAARDKKLMRKAKALMVTRVESGQLTHLNSPDPAVCWDRLASVPRHRGFSTIMMKRRIIRSAR